ncbi:hypothetical protein NDU88_003666 [Pleurodeles waltl]|uniref:Uncharacterized protein n=1 Tax=Pleurodeles waltl TaxID=8319 RepID=A0AAV7T5U2_PLEWA|nr:hypothetical protein NDU88_003666 [Pleurodeles waltl]
MFLPRFPSVCHRTGPPDQSASLCTITSTVSRMQRPLRLGCTHSPRSSWAQQLPLSFSGVPRDPTQPLRQRLGGQGRRPRCAFTSPLQLSGPRPARMGRTARRSSVLLRSAVEPANPRRAFQICAVLCGGLVILVVPWARPPLGSGSLWRAPPPKRHNFRSP